MSAIPRAFSRLTSSGLVKGLRDGRKRRRGKVDSANLLPLLIQVLASFSKIDGEVLEEEIDSILGFLRYDYPEAVYSELRRLYRQALDQQQDLSLMAQKLAAELSMDRKIMLGMQLYDLISRGGLKQEQVVAYYSFMSQLGMAAQAIDIVYQLNAAEDADPSVFQKGASPLESLCFGSRVDADVSLRSLKDGERLFAFRYHDLVLLRNLTGSALTVRGRPLPHGGFCRVYPGERVLLGEQVLTYPDFIYYFNAKKSVSLHQVFITVHDGEDVEIARSRTRESAIEVVFGLRVKVQALTDVDAELNGEALKSGVSLQASLDDRIIFHGRSELLLSELRRRARAMGGRFHLKSYKSDYLVSNNPSLLHEDDILLSPGLSGEILLRISCDYDQRIGKLEVLQANRPILVREQPVRATATLFDGDVIRIDSTQVLRCDFTERLIEEERNVIRTIEVRDLYHRFGNGELALDGISFSVSRGEMVCIMGASGSGKSTLLRCMAGLLNPERGSILLNGQELYEGLATLKEYIAYIPQEDTFDEHLTIHENLSFAAAIRAPHLSRKDRERRIESKLVELGLQERRDSLVGNPRRKNLSGGERKRLNIGLDMIGSGDVYLIDEPTSGLSSKDSEHVIEVLRSMAHNKIVLAVIHQPSAKLFHQFNKAALLDKGGRLVFFGTPKEMLFYFAQAEHEQQVDVEEQSEDLMRPEFIFDVLETPLRDLSGDVIFEENSRGQLVPARRYSPAYWRDKFESFHLVQDVREVPVHRPLPGELPPKPARPENEPMRWRNEWTQFRTLCARAFKSKMRNKANLLTTVVEAPLLAMLIAGVLRYSESGRYDFASAFHLPTYLFLSLVVAMFLGLTNSSDDVIRDRGMLQRERNLNVRISYYIIAKILTLSLFALIQCVLFILIGNLILEVRGMFLIYLWFMFLTSLTGLSIGLLVSALVPDGKTAANIVPLILIPQIILGGALIKYEEMNRNFDFIYAVQRMFALDPESAKEKTRSELEVPPMCEFMAMRWAYEALVVAQAKLNPLTLRQERVQMMVRKLAATEVLSADQERTLQQLKDLLAFLSGLEGKSPGDVNRRLHEAGRQLSSGTFNSDSLAPTGRGYTAEQMYVNQKISDLVSKAEMEEADYRKERVNVFFGLRKNYFGFESNLYVINSCVLISSCLAFLIILNVALHQELRVKTN
jgi:ABC-type multidrug transport system ATPase subunit